MESRIAQPRNEPNEGVRDDPSVAARRAMLMAACSGNPKQLRRGEIVATAAPSPAHDVSIDVDVPELEVVTEQAPSALHVVAAAGDSDSYMDSATEICSGVGGHILAAARDGNGDTPLHCAARAGNTRMVAHLIDLAGNTREALVGARNVKGETALHEAVRFGGVEMVGALMNADAGLACVLANDGTSPMYLASSLGRKDIARVLRKKAASYREPSYSGPDGQNALHAAAIHDKGITKLLLEWKRCLIYQRDINGSTPMHFAASAADPSFQFTSFVLTSLMPVRCHG